MAIYQPTNITPDLISGAENGVVVANPGGDIEISWSINGNSPLIAYRIEFFRNDAASTPGTDTGKITLAEPFCGKDAYGKEQRFSTSLPYGVGGTYFSIASLSQNKQGKIRITQWWGSAAEQSVVQRSLSVFQLSARSVATLSGPTAGADGRYTLDAEIALPAYASYGDVSVNWIRWRIFNASSGNTVEDTGVVWGATDYGYQTNMLLPGTYFAQFDFGTSNGLTATATSGNFSVAEADLQSNGLTAVCDKANGAVRLAAKTVEVTAGDYSGVGIDEDSITVNDPDGYAEVSFPAVSPEKWGFLWEGSVFRGASTLAENCIFRLTLDNGQIVSFGFGERNRQIYPILTPGQGTEEIDIQPFDFGADIRVAFCRTGTNEWAWRFAAYEQGGGNYDYTDWLYEPFSGGSPVKLEVFYNSKTTAFNILYGQDGIDIIGSAMESSAPFPGGNAPALTLTPQTFSVTALYFDILTAAVWRRRIGDAEYSKVADITGDTSFSWLDYQPGNGESYEYQIRTTSPDGTVIASQTEPVSPCFWEWLLIEAEPTETGFRGDYSVVNAFKFGMNLTSGSDGNGNSPNVLSNFTRYPTVQRDTQNRSSGTLAALIGSIVAPGEYMDTNETRDKIRALSTTQNALFLRNRRGDFMRIAIAGEIVTSTADTTKLQQITATIPWVEIGPVDGSVLKLLSGGGE